MNIIRNKWEEEEEESVRMDFFILFIISFL